MPTNITTISALRLNSDFTDIDISQQNRAVIQQDSSLQTLVGTAVQYQPATLDNPTGTWVVDNQRVTAGHILLAQVYSGWLSANSNAQTQLTAMNVNTILSKNASAFSKALRTQVDTATTGASWTYSDLTTLAGGYLTNSGMTASQFMTAMLPNEATDTVYTATELESLIEKVNQYANARLTDNNVLQSKYEVATSVINSCMNAMSNIMKAWQTMLSTLGRNL